MIFVIDYSNKGDNYTQKLTAIYLKTPKTGVEFCLYRGGILSI
jgi:hypothetical protein